MSESKKTEVTIHLKDRKLTEEITDAINVRLKEIESKPDLRKLRKELLVDQDGVVAWGISYHTRTAGVLTDDLQDQDL